MPKSFDEKCYELALMFLEDEPHLNTDKNADALACAIQECIEDWIRQAKDNYEPPDDPVAWSGGFANNH